MQGIKKYYLGLLVIAVLVVGLTIYLVVLGQGAKQDVATDKRAQDIAGKLNSYIDKNGTIPRSLAEAGITDVPSAIRYTPKGSDSYEFCVTYKAASSYANTDITSVIWGAALSNYSKANTSTYDASNTNPPSSLYLPYEHKKGQTCQTVTPYLSNSGLYHPDIYGTSITPPPPSPANASNPVNSANDVTRQTDIKSLYGQIEAYYAQNAFYPTLANLNDATWRAANMKGLNKEALRDPEGKDYTLAAVPAAKVYSYSVQASDGSACNNTTKGCAQYTLTATLSNGSMFVRNNLN